MSSRSNFDATRHEHAYLALFLQVCVAVSAIVFSLCANAQDFCAPGRVPIRFICSYGNGSWNLNTLCISTSITAIEASLRANNYPQASWSSWYPGSYYGSDAGITGTYLAIFVDLTGPDGTDYEAYGIGEDGCTTAAYFVTAPPRPAPSLSDFGRSCPVCKNGEDPVNPSSGGEFLVDTDVPSISSEHPLSFSRYFNSLDATSVDLGPGWRHNFSRHLTFDYSYPTVQPPATGFSSLYSSQAAACTSGWMQIRGQVQGLQNATASFSNGVCTLSLNGSALMTLPIYDNRGQYITVDSAISTLALVNAYRDDGHVINFTAGSSGFAAEPGVGYRLVSTSSGGYQLIDEQDTVEIYDSTGKLLSIADRAGNTQTLTYDSSTGRLSSVADNFGHALTLAYDSQNRLASVTAPDGSAVHYTYDSAGHLWQVTNLDGTTRQYEYVDSNWATGLSSVVDERGQTEFSLSYDSKGRVVKIGRAHV